MEIQLQDLISAYSGKQAELIKKAGEFAEKAHDHQLRKSGEQYFTHPKNVAKILVDLGMDGATIAAALLHDVIEDTEYSKETIAKEFGEDVAMLVDGVTKLGKVEFTSREEYQGESIRKMLLAMAKDIRVIMIKLADRLHNMRTLDYLSHEKQQRISQETIEIYAPIAHRLGIGTIRGELEDLAFKYLNPDEYKFIAEKKSSRYEERAQYIISVMELLKERLTVMNIKFQIDGRQKHLYSTYRKMKQQDKPFEEIYDTIAIRIITDSVKDCYAILGLVHTIWRPLPGRFKDYIAVPKSNMYQSLHTTLIGENGMPFEIQIRTFDMHRTAEYGIAAHWKYKEGSDDKEADMKLAWLRELLEWQNDLKDPGEFMDSLKIDLFSDTVFVFTPAGDVKDLVKGSTPLDFAYSIHSEVGHKCVGAKVNGRIVPLNYQLQTGDIVEVMTASGAHHPSRDWLNIVKTQSARTKIRQWFKRELKDENIVKGREMLEREAKRNGFALPQLMKSEWLEPINRKYSFNSLEDLYASVGYGGITTGQIIPRLVAEEKQERKQIIKEEAHKTAQKTPDHYTKSRGVLVKGEDDMVVRFAKCCNPVPGDEIVGYITRGRGVSVHQSDCSNLKDIMDKGGVFIEVSWAEEGKSSYLAEVQLVSDDRPGIMLEISRILVNMDINLSALNARSDTKTQTSNISMTLKIKDTQQLASVIRQFKKINGVQKVYRTQA